MVGKYDSERWICRVVRPVTGSPTLVYKFGGFCDSDHYPSSIGVRVVKIIITWRCKATNHCNRQSEASQRSGVTERSEGKVFYNAMRICTIAA